MSCQSHGAGGVGKFERYFRLFHRRLLPFVHSRRTVAAVFEPRSQEERERFLHDRWNNLRWRWLLKAFFSRRAMGALGRDPAFFDQVEGSVSDHVARRIEHAFVANDPVAKGAYDVIVSEGAVHHAPQAWLEGMSADGRMGLVERSGPMGKAKIFVPAEEGFGARDGFDAAPRYISGFEPKASFAL